MNITESSLSSDNTGRNILRMDSDGVVQVAVGVIILLLGSKEQYSTESTKHYPFFTSLPSYIVVIIMTAIIINIKHL